MLAVDGDPDPISAGTAGEAALWGGSSAVMGMAANPSEPIGSAHIQPTVWPVDMLPVMMLVGVSVRPAI